MAWNNNPYNNMMNNNMPMNGYTPSYTPQMGFNNMQPSMQTNQFVPQPQPQQMAPQNVAIQGRMVTSREEALGVPADFSGNPIFMPCLSEGKIYCKKFNMNTGASDFAEYRLVPTPQPQAQQDGNNMSFTPLQDFQNLNDMVSEMQDTINSLQKEIDRLKKPANSSTGKVAKKDE